LSDLAIGDLISYKEFEVSSPSEDPPNYCASEPRDMHFETIAIQRITPSAIIESQIPPRLRGVRPPPVLQYIL